MARNFRVFLVGLLASLALALPAAAEHMPPQHEPRHGGVLRPQINEDGSPSQWMAYLISAVGDAVNIEAWQQKDVMRCRILIELTEGDCDSAPADGDGIANGSEKKETSSVRPQADESSPKGGRTSVEGRIMYDVPNRRLLFETEEGWSFLVERTGFVNIWNRKSADPVNREDVPDQLLHEARSLAFVLVMPLRLTDFDDVRFGPGWHTRALGKDSFMGMLTVRDHDSRTPNGETPDDDVEGKDRSDVEAPLPPDWYMFFAEVFEPNRLQAIGYLAYDRSQRLTEIPMPRGVRFEAYDVVEDVLLPVRWTIWNFSRQEAIRGTDPIGSVTVSEISFGERADDAFRAPDHALRVR